MSILRGFEREGEGEERELKGGVERNDAKRKGKKNRKGTSQAKEKRKSQGRNGKGFGFDKAPVGSHRNGSLSSSK
jgi:hypothetical protein